MYVLSSTQKMFVEVRPDMTSIQEAADKHNVSTQLLDYLSGLAGNAPQFEFFGADVKGALETKSLILHVLIWHLKPLLHVVTEYRSNDRLHRSATWVESTLSSVVFALGIEPCSFRSLPPPGIIYLVLYIMLL